MGPSRLTVRLFQQLVQAKDFESAAKMIDEELAKDRSGTNLYLSFLLANSMVNAKEATGYARMESVAKLTSEELHDSPPPQVAIAFTMSHQSLAAKLASENKFSEAIDLLKGATSKLEATRQVRKPLPSCRSWCRC